MAYLQVGGARVYTESAGDGDPVLLLHGGFCSLESMRPQFDSLAADFEVFAYERPGHGRSPDIDGPYSYQAWLAEAVGYLDACLAGPAHIVGYSDGAILGLLLALHHPERVRSLVAISGNLDPSGFVDAPEAAGWPVLPPPTVSEAEPDRELLEYQRLSPDGPEHADVVLAKLFRLWAREPRIDPASLARVSARTLVMSGDRDTIRPDHSLLIAASIPDSRLCILPGASHGLVAEFPDLVTTLVRSFLLADAPGARRPATP
ncbi:MAG: alpha/beta hydrolase [Propionicimonas sp.]|nr:alpha/beta hydrolase [Propionicimonas sp.]